MRPGRPREASGNTPEKNQRPKNGRDDDDDGVVSSDREDAKSDRVDDDSDMDDGDENIVFEPRRSGRRITFDAAARPEFNPYSRGQDVEVYYRTDQKCYLARVVNAKAADRVTVKGRDGLLEFFIRDVRVASDGAMTSGRRDRRRFDLSDDAPADQMRRLHAFRVATAARAAAKATAERERRRQMIGRGVPIYAAARWCLLAARVLLNGGEAIDRLMAARAAVREAALALQRAAQSMEQVFSLPSECYIIGAGSTNTIANERRRALAHNLLTETSKCGYEFGRMQRKLFGEYVSARSRVAFPYSACHLHLLPALTH